MPIWSWQDTLPVRNPRLWNYLGFDLQPGSGEGLRMRKMIFLCRRKQGLSSAEYGRRILTNHVPLALEHHPTLQHYRVNLVEKPRGEPLVPIDSIAELSFATLADFRDRLYASEAGRRVITADTETFLGSAAAYETTEFVQKEPAEADKPAGASGRFKMIAILQRPDGQSREEFRRRWIEEHKPLALEHHEGLVKYVANVVDAQLAPEDLPIDGISELHFADEESFRTRLYAHPESRAIIAADTKKFIGKSCAWFVQEHHFR